MVHANDGSSLPYLPQAVCVEIDPEMWFPDANTNTKVAKKICAECPEKNPCLAYALTYNVTGIWGGTSLGQREELRRRRTIAS